MAEVLRENRVPPLRGPLLQEGGEGDELLGGIPEAALVPRLPWAGMILRLQRGRWSVLTAAMVWILVAAG
jgi:hypothetical protein